MKAARAFLQTAHIVGCWSFIQAAAERQTDGAVCVFSKLISSVERCQAEVLEVNNTDTVQEISI